MWQKISTLLSPLISIEEREMINHGESSSNFSKSLRTLFYQTIVTVTLCWLKQLCHYNASFQKSYLLDSSIWAYNRKNLEDEARLWDNIMIMVGHLYIMVISSFIKQAMSEK